VFDLRVAGAQSGLRDESLGRARVVRRVLSKGRPSRLLKPLLYLRWFFEGWRLARRFGPFDIVHAHGAGLTGNLGLLLRWAMGVPVVITEHSSPFPRFASRGFARALARHALERADATLFVSQGLLDEIRAAGIAPAQARVSGNPVDTELFRITSATPLAARRSVLFVGRLEQFKGALRSVQAFQRLGAAFPGWTMTVVGDGPEEPAIRALLDADRSLAARVRLAGRCGKDEIAAAMNEASFLVFPSERETFGLVVAEAMACGLPVIIGDSIAARDFVDAGCGLAVPARDIERIAAAMATLIGSLAAVDAPAIRARIVERFSFARFGSRMRDVYASLL
jgi:glycosyltransferase involved in cell wall biosynthesis